MGHEYLARRVTESELAQRSPFMMLAEEVPEARDHMGRYALAVVRQSDDSFVLLATERNLLTLNRASAEEIQDIAAPFCLPADFRYTPCSLSY